MALVNQIHWGTEHTWAQADMDSLGGVPVACRYLGLSDGTFVLKRADASLQTSRIDSFSYRSPSLYQRWGRWGEKGGREGAREKGEEGGGGTGS